MFFNLSIEYYSDKNSNLHLEDGLPEPECFEAVGYNDILLVLMARCGMAVSGEDFFKKIASKNIYTVIDDINNVIIRVSVR